MHKCGKTITLMTPGGREYKVKCGTPGPNEYHFCDPCDKKNEASYPQGWRYYPGDVCPHGVYVGGCGIDWMCGQCEVGDED